MQVFRKYGLVGASFGLVAAIVVYVLYLRAIAVSPSPHEGAYDIAFLAGYYLGFPVSAIANALADSLVASGAASPSLPLYGVLGAVPVLWGGLGAFIGWWKTRNTRAA